MYIISTLDVLVIFQYDENYLPSWFTKHLNAPGSDWDNIIDGKHGMKILRTSTLNVNTERQHWIWMYWQWLLPLKDENFQTICMGTCTSQNGRALLNCAKSLNFLEFISKSRLCIARMNVGVLNDVASYGYVLVSLT